MPILWRFVLMVILVSMVAFSPAAQAEGGEDTILDSPAIYVAPLQTLPQWQRIVEDYAFERAIAPSQKFQAWNRFITNLENETPLRQILKTNLWFNGFPYKQDNWIYGKEDHWASPSEFLEHGGDCEDFAIIKYITLRQLGFPAEAMKIAMVYDVFSGTDHALLFVSHNDDEFILDSRDNMTLPAHYTQRYKPHFAFNEQTLWTYDSPVIARAMDALREGEEDILPGNR